MKKRIALFSITFLTTILFINAQNDFGLKAGLSYNSNGKLLDETETIIDNKGKGKSGFNVGVYAKLDLGPIYLRPELVYTKTTSEYDLGNPTEFKTSKLDLPVLVGIKLLGPIKFFAGPAFQYTLDNDLHELSFNSLESDFSVGINLGVSVEFGRFGIDARYERGFSENEATFIDDHVVNDIPSYRLDSRPEQLIFSLSYSLSKPNKV